MIDLETHATDRTGHGPAPAATPGPTKPAPSAPAAVGPAFCAPPGLGTVAPAPVVSVAAPVVAGGGDLRFAPPGHGRPLERPTPPAHGDPELTTVVAQPDALRTAVHDRGAPLGIDDRTVVHRPTAPAISPHPPARPVTVRDGVVPAPRPGGPGAIAAPGGPVFARPAGGAPVSATLGLVPERAQAAPTAPPPAWSPPGQAWPPPAPASSPPRIDPASLAVDDLPARSRTPLVTPRPGVRRSAAWVYYAILAVLGLIATVSLGEPKGLIAALVCGAYSVYLFRGGRFVVWIW